MNDKTKKYLKYGFNTAILIGVIMAANKYLNGEEVFNALKDFNYTYAPYMLLIALGFLLH